MKYLLYRFFLFWIIISSPLLAAAESTDTPILTEYSSKEEQQRKPYLIDLSKEPNYSDFHEGILRESNIPRESYMPIKYVGYLTQKEYELCTKGCEQRTKALLLFLKDIYSGEKRVIKDGIIPENVVNYALKSEGFEELIGKIPLENIAITNGSDINLKRNAEGKMVVIEDNIGSLGGREDIYAIPDIYRKAFSNNSVLDPYELEGEYLNQLKSWVSYLPGEYALYCSDVEREEDTFAPKKEKVKKMGIHLANQDEIYVADNKLFFKSKDMSEPIEISYLEHNGLDYTLDLDFPPFLKRCLDVDDDANYYQDIPGSMKVFLSNNLILSHSPGSSLPDSKIIYPFVEEFIRYYLHEEPLLGSTKAYCLNWEGNPCYDMPSLTLSEALTRKDELVLKPINGACGENVVVGKKASQEKWEEIVSDTYELEPEHFLFFEYSNILEEDNYLLIHRVFVDAFQDHVATRPGAYLRMKEVDGDGVISTGNPGTIATATLIENVNIRKSL